jgi:hypothetical protein
MDYNRGQRLILTGNKIARAHEKKNASGVVGTVLKSSGTAGQFNIKLNFFHIHALEA